MISRRVLNRWRFYRESEKREIYPSQGWEVSVLLVFPNVYTVGVSNLGFQTIYRVLNEAQGVSCDLLYLPEDRDLMECESGFELVSFYLERTPLEFDVILFSISFENDLLNVIKLLKLMRIPVLSSEREETHPVVGAGGIVPTANPEPFAPFFDFIILGDGEDITPQILKAFSASSEKKNFLEEVSYWETIYVPSKYTIKEGLFSISIPKNNLPYPLKRYIYKDFIKKGNSSVIKTPFGVFGDIDIIEVSRGCPRRCFFCLSSYLHKPVRFVKTRVVEEMVEGSSSFKIGFLGTSVSEHRGLVKVIKKFPQKIFSFSSIRVDAHSIFIEAVRSSGSRTITFGIEAATERLREKIGKPIKDELVVERLSQLSNFFETIKLYFMVGLPDETDEDIEAFSDFISKIISKSQKINFTISISPFVPKPHTPFERAPFDGVGNIKTKITRIRKALSSFKRIKVTYDLPKWAKIQTIISRGDRKVGLYLAGHLKGLDLTPYLSCIPSGVIVPWSIVEL